MTPHHPLLALLATAVPLAACGRTDDMAVAAPAAPALPKVDPIAKGIPHGGQIAQVAISQDADAALTFDTIGGVRLWPALDGSRPPVPVAVVAPEQLAIGHAGRDVLAAILDEAGSIWLLRLGRDGIRRADAQLRAEVAYQQIVALDDGVLARRADQVIEWFTPDGFSQARLVAEPGHRIVSLVASNGRAVAIVGAGEKQELRWIIAMNGVMSWGAAVTLPIPGQGDLFALSPSHRRLALVDGESTLQVYEIGLAVAHLDNTRVSRDVADLGFIDEENIAIMGRTLQWWSLATAVNDDPWANAAPNLPVPSTMQAIQDGAVSHGKVVMGFGAALAIVDKERAQYLGYQEHGVGNIGIGESSLWIAMSGSHIVWLDDKLALQREIELRKDQTGPWVYGQPVGDRHVVTQTPVDGKYKVELIDLDKRDNPVVVGTWSSVDRLEYTADTHLLGIAIPGKILRFKVDTAATTVTELPAVRTRGSVVQLRLFDPERANGIIAMTLGWASDYDENYTLTVHRTKGKPKRIRPFTGRVIDYDERGTLYVANGDELQIRTAEKKLASLKLDNLGVSAVSPDGARFAVMTRTEVLMLDARGTELWRKSLWGTQQIVFGKDAKQLVVRANGGLVTLDVATGERKGMECGWSFALSTTPPPTNALASAPVCEDPML